MLILNYLLCVNWTSSEPERWLTIPFHQKEDKDLKQSFLLLERAMDQSRTLGAS